MLEFQLVQGALGLRALIQVCHLLRKERWILCECHALTQREREHHKRSGHDWKANGPPADSSQHHSPGSLSGERYRFVP
ncbi:MAG TPA: hypothetical protein PKD27_00125 [Tepidiformaceae bacterium]|nr:hypothetical protein [Tepidiformaceae bacterium]